MVVFVSVIGFVLIIKPAVVRIGTIVISRWCIITVMPVWLIRIVVWRRDITEITVADLD